MTRKLFFTRLFSLLLCALLLLSLTACRSSDGHSSDKLQVVVTIFPPYDWAREIIGENADNVELTLLLQNGVDMHSYQPSTADIMKISGCDLLIYIGGESDEWIEDVLAEAVNSDLVALNLMEVLGDTVKEEEVIEGMESANDAQHHTDEAEYDEHIWLSLRNAELLVSAIEETLSGIDPSHADTYLANAEQYLTKLRELDQAYSETVNTASRDIVLFADRFPFRYLTDDYALTYYAAFPGCSAETEASFSTITYLADKTIEHALPAILILENSDASIAETIRDATLTKNQKILTMDSLQSVTAEDIRSGVTYLSVMESNLNILKEALN